MRKIVLLFTACLLAAKVAAVPAGDGKGVKIDERQLKPLAPVYLENVYGSSTWGSNWMLSIKGGISAFAGSPVGHGDLFGRTNAMLNASFGKMFSPYFGARLAFQGFQFKDSELENRKFQNLHVDILYNVSSHLRSNYETLPRWDFMLYGGTGIIHNGYNGQKPFAISLGLIGKYRITERLHAEGEFGLTTTWRDFDGIGERNKLGDNLLHASIGLSVTIGQLGFRRVVDPDPFITQNDVLMEYVEKLRDQNTDLQKAHAKDALALTEMRKILEIEGLLEKYCLSVPQDSLGNVQTRNNYSGLNSLRARMNAKNKPKIEASDSTELAVNFSGDFPKDSIVGKEEYFKLMRDGKVYVGSPIYFFFKISQDVLTDKAQVINIKEVASTMKRFGMYARVIGAADSQTGTPYGNEKLSKKRADYIANILRKNGVDEDKIVLQYRGGISEYKPVAGNRNACIMLFFK